MTFLQPFILWGLPLLLLPIVIHLLNRMRYRSQPWGAMRLLVAANRSSISQAKLRQFLILLFRVLAVAALILFLARPISGGWMGWMLSPAPDTVIILLDRSASMETTAADGTSRRTQALELIADAAKPYQGSSHFVLVESALRQPQPLANINALAELSLAAPTDTAADIPAMLQAAANWIIENRSGASEIWIASDLQRSNWLPDDSRFKNVMAQLGALPQRVRVRLLALNEPAVRNASVAVSEVLRRQGFNDLQFAIDIERHGSSSTGAAAKEPIAFPLVLTIDGSASQHEIAMDGQAFRWRHRVPLGERKSGGFGSVRIPADSNARDNVAYFVYGVETALRMSVVAGDTQSGRILKAAADALTRTLATNDVFAPGNASSLSLDETALLVWQGPLPDGDVAARIREFVSEGGVALFFPPGIVEAGRFNGLGWGEVQTAEAGKLFEAGRWDEVDGPLAKTDEGLSLPLKETEFQKRQIIVGQKSSIAGFSDAETLVARQSLGKGEIYFCASLPSADWSSLSDGPVLIPMLQRLLQSGGRRLQQVSMIACGDLSAVDRSKQWTCVDSTEPKDIQLNAGVYRGEGRLVAVNRPAAEDDPEILDTAVVNQLFSGVTFQLWQERGDGAGALQREIWRVFLFAMLMFLFIEGLLILPKMKQANAPANFSWRGAGATAMRVLVLAVLSVTFVELGMRWLL